MIVSKLIGGLGNQLFQYAVGRKLALDRGINLKLDISGFSEYQLRNYELCHFNIQAEIATDAQLVSFQRLKTLTQKFPRFARVLHRSIRKFWAQEEAFSFQPWIHRVSGHVYLDGYWQSEKYFKDIGDILRRDFSLKEELSEGARFFSQKIQEQKVAVSLHVRRGDYISNQQVNQIHGVCPIDYYDRAIRHISRIVYTPHFFVFSDDIEWVIANLKIDHPVTIIKNNSSHEDLHLMSLCRHHIIANSSFSWWGAWLNPSPDKVVIAPSPWFRSNIHDTRDLLPEKWIAL